MLAIARPRWRVSRVDAELRYGPVIANLPEEGPICEVGSGGGGLAEWTHRTVFGVDPREIPGGPENMVQICANGTDLPFDDETFACAVAIDTLEHVNTSDRQAVISEMVRVVMEGGRVIVIGPTGPAARLGDQRVLAKLEQRGAGSGNSARWLGEHMAIGLPSDEELQELFAVPRVRSISLQHVFNIWLWYTMHLAAMGALPRLGPLHRAVWSPFAWLARRWHRGPCYRSLLIADIGSHPSA